MNKNVIISIILIIIVGAGAFWGGMQYQRSRTRSAFGQFGGQMGGQGFARRFGANGQNGAAVRGKITNVTDNSITVESPDGSSKIILLSNSTNINKATSGSKSDLSSGQEVMAVGTTNSDGSVTAQLVQINPMMPQGGSKPVTPTQ